MTLTLTSSEKTLGGVYLVLQMLLVPWAVTRLCLFAGITSDAAANLICFFLNAVLAAVLFRTLLVRSWRSAAKSWGHTLGITVRGLGLYFLINILVRTLILFLRPDFSNTNDAQVNAMIDKFPVLMTVALVFLAPLAEECLFRGWIFTGLAQKSIPLAYIVTCGLFSAAHVVGYIGTVDPVTLLLNLLQYLGPSFVLCRTCQKSDSLVPPLALHMCINALGCIFLR